MYGEVRARHLPPINDFINSTHPTGNIDQHGITSTPASNRHFHVIRVSIQGQREHTEERSTNFRLPKLSTCVEGKVPPLSARFRSESVREQAPDGSDMTTDLILTSRSQPTAAPSTTNTPGPSKLPTLKKGTAFPAAPAAPAVTASGAGDDHLLALGLPRLVHIGSSSVATDAVAAANKVQFKVRLTEQTIGYTEILIHLKRPLKQYQRWF